MTRIATTHVGSLPRSQRTVDFIFARERGESCDADDFAACMTDECSETVSRQAEAGIDIVSGGETSKISYSTYVKDRYTGFSGDSERNAPADLKLFPRYHEHIAREGGTPQFSRPQCTGPVASKGDAEFMADIANLKAAMETHGVERGFMNAASPGVIAQFLPNAWYASHEAYLEALADDMILVPGVIDSTSNFVEHPELVAQRIERFVGIVGADRVIAGTDCGFGTFAGFGAVDPDIAYVKLAALAEGAAIASART